MWRTRELPQLQPAYARLPPQVQGRKRDRDSYSGAKARHGDFQHRPGPPITGITGPQEGLWHCVPRPTYNHTLGVWSGTSDVWALGDLMGLSADGAKAEHIPHTGIPCHKGYNAGRNRIPDAVQRSGIKCHKNLSGHESRVPEGVSWRSERYRWAVLGSLLCRRWHGRLTRLGLATARDECLGWNF